MAINIDIAANTRDFQRGAQDVERALDEVADSLDDLARDSRRSSERAGDELADGIGDGAKEAGDEVDKLERTFRDLADEAKDAGRKGGRDFGGELGDGAKRGARKAEDALDELQKEAGQSGREAAASFSGDFDDVLDFAQETIANGLGPAGIAGAVIVGAVAGTAVESVTKWNETIDGIRQATADMWEKASDEGEKYLSEDAIRAEIHRLRWSDQYDGLVEDAERIGVSTETMLAAMAGDEDALKVATEAARDAYAEKNEKIAESNVLLGESNTAIDGEAVKIKQAIDKLGEKAKAQEANKQKVQDEQRAVEERDKKEAEGQSRARTADQKRWEAQGKYWDDYKKKVANPAEAKVKVTTDKAQAERDLEDLVRERTAYIDVQVRKGRIVI